MLKRVQHDTRRGPTWIPDPDFAECFVEARQVGNDYMCEYEPGCIDQLPHGIIINKCGVVYGSTGGS